MNIRSRVGGLGPCEFVTAARSADQLLKSIGSSKDYSFSDLCIKMDTFVFEGDYDSTDTSSNGSEEGSESEDMIPEMDKLRLNPYR